MASSFSKNAILDGVVDYFCLVCETYLRSERETELHFTDPGHQDNLNSAHYLEEFKIDKIKKIKNRYFCELCNKLFTVLTRVRLHVTELAHIDKKNSNSVKRVGDHIVALENMIINDQSWNGLNEKSCTICNTEYDNKETHKNSTTHILNLIQKKVEIDKNINIFRKVDDSSIQCLTCNVVVLLNYFNQHIDQKEHKIFYQACRDAYKMIDSKELQGPKPTHIANDNLNVEQKDVIIKNNDECKAKSMVLEEVDVTPIQKHMLDMKKKEKTSIVNKNNDINNQKGSHNNMVRNKVEDTSLCDYTFDEKCEKTICKVLGTDNYITLDENGIVYCILCDWAMGSFNDVDHINGMHHQVILKMHKNRLEKLKNKYNSKRENNTTQILDSVNKFKKSDININFETNTAFCKKCFKNVKFDYKCIKAHISEHSQNKSLDEKPITPIKLEARDDKISDQNKSSFSKPVFLKHDISQAKTTNKITKGNNTLEDSFKDTLNAAFEHVEKISTETVEETKQIHINMDFEELPINLKSNSTKGFRPFIGWLTHVF